jgi:hypothetical protein
MGLAVYGVEVGAAVMNSLEIAGYLKEYELTDKAKVANALGLALSQWADDILSSRVTQIARARP